MTLDFTKAPKSTLSSRCFGPDFLNGVEDIRKFGTRFHVGNVRRSPLSLATWTLWRSHERLNESCSSLTRKAQNHSNILDHQDGRIFFTL
jgi:hypothetical protein